MMRISEATIRSIVRRKLLESTDELKSSVVSIPTTSNQDDVEKFLQGLEDGSTILARRNLIRKKENGKFVIPDSDQTQDAATLAHLMFNNTPYGLDEFEVYDSKEKKLYASLEKWRKEVSAKPPPASELSPEEKATLEKWRKEVSARPLQLGSKGPNVGILQDLLTKALGKIPADLSLGPDKNTAIKAQFNPLVKPDKDGNRPRAPGAKGAHRISIEPGEYNTLGQIADSLALSLGRDNDFGPVTRVAVYFFQHANNLQPDGRVGKDTAAALMKYAKPS
jgi:hypothetical protein